MSKLITIPGGTARLREPHELRQRHRRMVELAAMAAAHVIAKLPEGADETTKLSDIPALSIADAEAITNLQDVTILAVLESWSRPDPLPTLETLGDLDVDTYDALAAAAKDLKDVRVDFSPSPEPDSPTQGSNDSNGRSADEMSMSTLTSPDSTESSVSVV